jgi:hypothetical protein
LRSSGPPLLLDRATAAERATFYETILGLPWLPSGVRAAVMQELGLSLRKQNERDEEARTEMLRFVFEWYKKELQQIKTQPRGEAAMEYTASIGGMTPETLKKRFVRLKRRNRATKAPRAVG